MNCHDISHILDERGTAALSTAERADFDAHIARCAECAGQSRASERLLSFRTDVPPLPAALQDRARQLEDLRSAKAPASRSRRPLLIGGLLLIGAGATMFAAVPWGDTSTANQ
jgi:hypothetical protein